MINENIKFRCYYCSQHIRAFREHIGQSIPCPSCGSMITVPRESSAGEEVEEELVVVRRFTDEELNLIRREGARAYEAFIGGAVREYWQFDLLADLLSKRLEPLQDTVLDIIRPQEVWDREVVSHTQFVTFIAEKDLEFFGLMYVLADRMATQLDKVLYQDNLNLIIGFANEMAFVFNRLKGFHDSLYEKALPAEYPYPQLQGIMKGWAPYCWQSMNNVIDELKQLSKHKQDDQSWRGIQMSFAPATLHEYYYHKLALPEPDPELF